MTKQGYKSIRRAQKIIDRDRESIRKQRLNRMGCPDGNVSPAEGVGGTRRVGGEIVNPPS